MRTQRSVLETRPVHASSKLTVLVMLSISLFGFAAWGLSGPVRCQSATKSAKPIVADSIVSQPSKNIFLQKQTLQSSTVDSGSPGIDTGGSESCQTMRGNGFALSESTVINLNRLPAKLRQETLNQIFSPEEANLSYVILPLSSTDFNDSSRGDFSVCDCGGKTPDPNGSCFDPSRLKDSMALLSEAKKINGNLQVLLKPWTTPPYMKVPGSMKNSSGYRGGEFDPKWNGSLAKCLVSAVDYVQKTGIKVQAVAVQNEPGLSLPYPSVVVRDQDHAHVLDLVQKGLNQVSPATQLIIRSDNFISTPGVRAELTDMLMKPAHAVFAAHCYSNDPWTPKQLLPSGETRFCSDKMPQNLEYAMGECTGSGIPKDAQDFDWWMKNRIFADVDFGAGSVIGWNGVLDQNFGPKNGGCSNCRGLITTDFSGAQPVLRKNPELMALEHLSHFVSPGAKRILDRSEASATTHLVFKNTDGSKVVMLRNDGEAEVNNDLIGDDCQHIPVKLPPHSYVTVRWSEAGR